MLVNGSPRTRRALPVIALGGIVAALLVAVDVSPARARSRAGLASATATEERPGDPIEPTPPPPKPEPSTNEPGTRIVGGQLASEGEYPYFAQIIATDSDLVCGGTLISSTRILTAAHCAQEPDSPFIHHAVIGKNDFTPFSDEIYIDEEIRHPDYDPDFCASTIPQNDIAILVLEEPSTQPWTRLAELGDAPWFETDDPLTTVGFGATEEGGDPVFDLYEVTVPKRSDAEMTTAYGSCFDSSTMFGAGTLAGGHDHCNGDSGGPLLVENSAVREPVLGVVSWANGCARPGFPGVNGEAWDAPLRAFIDANVPRPGNDDFVSRQVVTGASGSVAGSTTDATNEPTEPGVPSAEATVWYSWTAPQSGPAAFTLDASAAFDTTIKVSTGSSLSGLTLVAENDDTTVGIQSEVEFNAVAGTTYQIQVDGFSLADQHHGPFTMTWSVPTPVNDDFNEASVLPGAVGRVTGTTAGATRQHGEPAAHAGATSEDSVWYTWTPPESGPATISLQGSTFDTAVAVYTGSTLATLATVATGDDFGGTQQSKVELTVTAGTTYRIAIDGFFGASGPVSVGYVVNPATNDDFDAPVVVSPATDGLITGSTARTSGEPGEPAFHGGAASDESAWYSWTPTESGPAIVSLRGSAFDTGFGVYTGTTINGLTEVPGQTYNGNFGGTTQSKTRFNAVVGTTYRIAIDGNSGTSGAITVQWSIGTPANDDLAAATTITGASGSAPGTTSRSSGEPGEATPVASAPDRSVWFAWTAPSTGTFGFAAATDGTTDPQIGIYTGSAFPLVLVAADDDDGPALDPVLELAATAGTTYRIQAEAVSAVRGPFTLRWGAVPPTISIGDATVVEGNAGTTSAVFTATLSGPRTSNVTVSYQTSNGSAAQPGDYTLTSGTLTFAPGVTSQTLAVPVVGDTLDEANETFGVGLFGAAGAAIADGFGLGTITNDDAPAGAMCTAMPATIVGTTGPDVIVGTAGNDVIAGLAGDDVIDGAGGNDTICGGEGNDTLRGGTGDDALRGDAGSDTASFSMSATAVVADLATNVATGEGADGFSSIENLTGSAFPDTLTGNGVANVLAGGGAADLITGSSGNDTLRGDGGPDDLRGGPGDDTLEGGLAADTLRGDDGNDTINGGDAVDTVTYAASANAVNVNLATGQGTGQGTDTLLAIEDAIGSQLADILTGSSGANKLQGLGGHDQINGGDGNDDLRGNGGNDTLTGSNGDDNLAGGSGADTLLGGTGTDTLAGQTGTPDHCDGGADNDLNGGGCETLASLP